jgi:hypothetical protein
MGTFSQVNAADVIIMEGILVFHDSRVRDLMNMKIFVDTGSAFDVLLLHIHIVKFTNPSILFGFAYLQIWVMPQRSSKLCFWSNNQLT